MSLSEDLNLVTLLLLLLKYSFCRFVFKVHNEFILPSEKEGFIHRMGDIIKRAESLMAKGQPVHSGGHRLPQPAFHSGANSLSSSQVGNPPHSIVSREQRK